MSALPLADELLLHLAASDRRAAAQHCTALIGSGMALEHLIDNGLAPAMTQVGALWESAVWSVVDEHIATAVAEAALSAAAAECRPAGPNGEVVVACAEGDWHSLPARMVAEVLDAHGSSVRFLGASQPTSLLVDHLNRHRPDAVLLSCAVPMALPALLSAVQDIHGLDLPVYVGGRALGNSPARALALGADGWSPNAAGAIELLAHLPLAAIPHPQAAPDLSAYRASQLLLTAWVDDAMDALCTMMPAVRAFTPEVRDRTRLDLRHLLDTASIALMLNDPTLMDEQCHWLAQVLAARGVAPQALAYGLIALHETEPPGEHDPRIGPALKQAQHHLANSSHRGTAPAPDNPRQR